MAAPITSHHDKQALPLDHGRRRSVRVLLSVPIHVVGKTKDNEDFSEDARTLVVNAHGALISLAAKVVAGQLITMSNEATRKSQECRVVYVGNATTGKVQMGVEFLGPSPSFWQIDFPPDNWVVPEN
jgi:c-di-GMP-binding flagellar brake protein YcgR